MFKKDRKDVFTRGQRLVGKLRKCSKQYSSKFENLVASQDVDPEAVKMFRETVALLDECCSFSDSYLALEKKRQAQLDRIEKGITEIKGLLEAKE